VIIVTSGAIGVGKQRLKKRKLVNSSFADLQKQQMELDGKACAAVGQSGLMALYDMLFTQVCLAPFGCADKPAEKHCWLICCERKYYSG
jgi:glutamate 5-kinase